MKRRLLIPIGLLASMLTAGAAFAQAPTWNTGYNGWWPGGFGSPPLTVHAAHYPCSVTAYGPTFRSPAGGWIGAYGGGTSCSGGVGEKTLTVYEQVRGPGGHRWFTISGSTVVVGPSETNPLRVIRHRRAFLGHEYRTVASARLVVPNGHAGCSLTNTCDETITITARSRGLAP